MKPSEDGNRWDGFLYPTGTIYAYGEAAVGVYAKVTHYKDLDKWLFFAAIYTSDDGGCSFHSNYTTESKARQEMHSFIDWITDCEFACPNQTHIDFYCIHAGLTVSFN